MTHDHDVPSRGWWERNWKWAVPSGCFVILIGILGLVVALVAVVAGSVRSSWAYTEGVALATRHPEVVAALGEPIEIGWFVRGSIHLSGSSGEADLAIPLRGPNGRGTLYVTARRSAGEWELELAEVELGGSDRRIDLLVEPGFLRTSH